MPGNHQKRNTLFPESTVRRILLAAWWLTACKKCGIKCVVLAIAMAIKYYQFDYAEMKGSEIIRLGCLFIKTEKGLTKESLKEHARKHLQKPSTTIMISNITKLTKTEFEQNAAPHTIENNAGTGSE